MATDTIQQKKCFECQIEQPITNFNWRLKSKGWRDCRCKTCYRQRTRNRRQNRSWEISPTNVRKFFERLEKTDTCWIWTGWKMPKGYGMFSFNGVSMLAHRFSYLYHFGELPDDKMVCHHCDNPSCVNPEHFFLGTASDNLQDMARKGRRKGERHALVKLSEADVLAIRADTTKSQTALGQEYGVSQTTVGEIKRREIWTHI